MQRRARYLTANGPLCVHCKRRGVFRAWSQLDHVVSLEHGGSDTFDNLQGLCTPCHRAKTQADRGYKPIGGDAEGMPTDDRHPWNRDT